MHIEVDDAARHGPAARLSGLSGFRDEALNAKNPFTPVKGEEGLQQGTLSLNGSIVPNKSSFSLSRAASAGIFDSGNILAAVPGGTVASRDPAAGRPDQHQRAVRSGDQARRT